MKQKDIERYRRELEETITQMRGSWEEAMHGGQSAAYKYDTAYANGLEEALRKFNAIFPKGRKK